MTVDYKLKSEYYICYSQYRSDQIKKKNNNINKKNNAVQSLQFDEMIKWYLGINQLEKKVFFQSIMQ